MTSIDDSFNSTGSVVSFETINNNKQALGVGVTGSQCGVYGESSHSPVGTRPPISNVPEGTGVAGAGDSCGVQGSSQKIGIIGSGGKGGTGVFGVSESGTGVSGNSSDGDGVVGKSLDGRGGVFGSDHLAQVQLVPQDLGIEPFDAVVTPVKVIPIKEAPALPTGGRGGDLIAVKDNSKQCTLWFCVEDEDGGRAAQWAQVLLGDAFDGRRP
jgi:hypothetical protein